MDGKQLGFGDYEQSTAKKRNKRENFSLKWTRWCLVCRPGDLQAKSVQLLQDGISCRSPVERGFGLVVGRPNCSIFAISSLTLEKLPRRIARCVMIPNQRSTWFSQEA